MRVSDTLGFLAGTWQLHRSLTDRRSGVSGVFTGTAGFAPVPGQPGTLRYREEGELRFGRHSGPARRELLWLAAVPGTADVCFADGRPFYPADLRTGRWQAEHRCGNDVYHVTYHVLDGDLLTELWRAHGPGKDYLSATTLVRI
jgi:hypothetical protein